MKLPEKIGDLYHEFKKLKNEDEINDFVKKLQKIIEIGYNNYNFSERRGVIETFSPDDEFLEINVHPKICDNFSRNFPDEYDYIDVILFRCRKLLSGYDLTISSNLIKYYFALDFKPLVLLSQDTGRDKEKEGFEYGDFISEASDEDLKYYSLFNSLEDSEPQDIYSTLEQIRSHKSVDVTLVNDVILKIKEIEDLLSDKGIRYITKCELQFTLRDTIKKLGILRYSILSMPDPLRKKLKKNQNVNDLNTFIPPNAEVNLGFLGYYSRKLYRAYVLEEKVDDNSCDSRNKCIDEILEILISFNAATREDRNKIYQSIQKVRNRDIKNKNTNTNKK